MENGEMDFYNSSFIDFRGSYMLNCREMRTSRCTVIRTFLAIFPTSPKSYATIFWGYRGPHIGPTNTNHTKNFKKN